jgi:site-specific DNA-cytosine methylase
MKHLGDISKINGAEVEPVDVITFGSPCQDLSVAGKRAGLKHQDNGDDETTRSGLFMEAVRIIKEMRGATNGEYPKFAVWENVQGAFSSNGGQDFRIVLEELIKVADPYAVMPEVPKKGWPYADCYSGDGWSLAYRVFDAQYWGVPQRRRRIYLVADFRGQCARQILFERESLRGYFAQSGTPWQGTASDAEGSLGATDREGAQPDALVERGENQDSESGFRDRQDGRGRDDRGLPVACGVSTGRNGVIGHGAGGLDAVVPYTLKIRSGCEGGGKGALIQEDLSATLATNNDQYLFQPVCYGISSYDSNAMKSSNPHSGIYEAETSRTIDLNGGNPACNQGGIAIVQGIDGYNQTLTGDKTMSVTGAASDIHHVPGVVYSVENHPADSRVDLDESGKVQTLTSRMGTGGGNVPMVLEPFCKSHRAQTADDATTWKHADKANTLNTFDQGEARANELVVYCLQGNGIDRADTAGCNGKGWRERQSYTLNTIDRPAVVYALDRAFYNQGKNALYEPQCYEDGTNPTLVAKGPSAVCHAIGNGQADNTGLHEIPGALNCMHDQQAVMVGVPPRYIVRRLTPTECARLQGFPDKWGHIEPKAEFTDEEYVFWLDVRHTREVVIDGKDPKDLKDYTKKQMLTWYNKLWTDSAEYKMWGNGIALPCALYVMQGIAERR